MTDPNLQGDARAEFVIHFCLGCSVERTDVEADGLHLDRCPNCGDGRDPVPLDGAISGFHRWLHIIDADHREVGMLDAFRAGLAASDAETSARASRMEDALKQLEAWDMLSLDRHGHGVATADAPWARDLIRRALLTEEKQG